MKYIWASPCPKRADSSRTPLEVRNVPNACVFGRKMWPPLSHSQLQAVLVFNGPVPVDHLAWANLIAGCSGYLDQLSLVSK